MSTWGVGENLWYYERLWRRLHGYKVDRTKYDLGYAKTECGKCGKKVKKYGKQTHVCRPILKIDWEAVERIGAR
jgi:hypothetical protein